MVIDLFPISLFPINLFTQMHGYSMCTAVTKSRQQRRRNKTKQNNGEEDRPSRREEETYAWWRNLCKLFSCASLRQYDNHNGFIKRLKYHFWKLSYCICHFLIKSSYLIELLLDQVTQELVNWINSQLEQSATDDYWTTGG